MPPPAATPVRGLRPARPIPAGAAGSALGSPEPDSGDSSAPRAGTTPVSAVVNQRVGEVRKLLSGSPLVCRKPPLWLTASDGNWGTSLAPETRLLLRNLRS